MKDLKQRVIRGGLAKIVSQVTTLLLRTGSLMIMARLRRPQGFRSGGHGDRCDWGFQCL